MCHNPNRGNCQTCRSVCTCTWSWCTRPVGGRSSSIQKHFQPSFICAVVLKNSRAIAIANGNVFAKHVHVQPIAKFIRRSRYVYIYIIVIMTSVPLPKLASESEFKMHMCAPGRGPRAVRVRSIAINITYISKRSSHACSWNSLIYICIMITAQRTSAVPNSLLVVLPGSSVVCSTVHVATDRYTVVGAGDCIHVG